MREKGQEQYTRRKSLCELRWGKDTYLVHMACRYVCDINARLTLSLTD